MTDAIAQEYAVEAKKASNNIKQMFEKQAEDARVCARCSDGNIR